MGNILWWLIMNKKLLPDHPPSPKTRYPGWTGYPSVFAYSGQTGNTGHSKTCLQHNDNHHALTLYDWLNADIRNGNVEAVAVYKEKFGNLPCYALDEAKSFEMIEVLKREGACCTNNRSELAHKLIDANIPTISYFPCFSIDDAILCGHIEYLHTLVFDMHATSPMQAPHWNDWIVQDYMINMIYPEFLQACKMSLQSVPIVIVDLICQFLKSMDIVRARIHTS